MTHVWEVVGLNPDTIYWMDMTFLYIDLLWKLYLLFEKTKNKQKEAGLAHIFKKNKKLKHI